MYHGTRDVWITWADGKSERMTAYEKPFAKEGVLHIKMDGNLWRYIPLTSIRKWEARDW